MEQHRKHTVEIMVIGAVLLVIALNIKNIGGMILNLWGLIMPIVIGGVIAFVMNVPMKGFEKLINKISGKLKKELSPKHTAMLSMWLTLLSLVLVIVVVITLVVPELIQSLVGLYKVIEEAIPEIFAFLEENVDPRWVDVNWIRENLTKALNSTNISKVIVNLSNGAYDVLGVVFSVATSTLGTLLSMGMSLIVAIYMLLSKKKLARQAKKLLYAFLKKPIADKLCYTGRLVNVTYAKFLSGQCMEAFIIAILIFISFTICGLPYASLVGVLAGVLSFIPYIGSWMACAIGAILILIISPWKALLSVAVYQIIQFLEGQLIYPRVVGSSVGLPPLYTLLAAIMGANLFGIVGVIFFIPLFAVIYTLIKEVTNKRLEKKKIDVQ